MSPVVAPYSGVTALFVGKDWTKLILRVQIYAIAVVVKGVGEHCICPLGPVVNKKRGISIVVAG